jgi:hypothetical protein
MLPESYDPIATRERNSQQRQTGCRSARRRREAETAAAGRSIKEQNAQEEGRPYQCRAIETLGGSVVRSGNPPLRSRLQRPVPTHRPCAVTFFTTVSALALATVSAGFSVSGMTSIFVGAFWPVIARGVALESGKLGAVAWLRHSLCAFRRTAVRMPAFGFVVRLRDRGWIYRPRTSSMSRTVRQQECINKAEVLFRRPSSTYLSGLTFMREAYELRRL